MTIAEKAYLAGIIDGEGSILLTSIKRNQHPSPCVSVASTDLELLVWIQQVTGFGKINPKRNYNKEKHKNSYSYSVRYNNALRLLEEIETFLIIKNKKS